MNRLVEVTYRQARRIAISVLGTTILLMGVAMLVLPGPAMLMIPLGLAILALEFTWARLWLRRIKLSARQLQRKAGLASGGTVRTPRPVAPREGT
jgi:tellurite resistance protein TerC